MRKPTIAIYAAVIAGSMAVGPASGSGCPADLGAPLRDSQPGRNRHNVALSALIEEELLCLL